MNHKEIAEWRHKHKLSQTELAAALPMNVRTLQDWEHGRGTPPAYLMRALRDLARELRKA